MYQRFPQLTHSYSVLQLQCITATVYYSYSCVFIIYYYCEQTYCPYINQHVLYYGIRNPALRSRVAYSGGDVHSYLTILSVLQAVFVLLQLRESNKYLLFFTGANDMF